MLCSRTPFNCSLDLQSTTLPVNPDIVGIGVSFYLTLDILYSTNDLLEVITSFCITAAASVLIIVYLAFPTNLRQYTGEREAKHTKAIQRILLALGDQMLITGTVIQIAAYIEFCSIHGKHFLIVWILAGLSMMIHLLAVFQLKDYFERLSLTLIIRAFAVMINGIFLGGGSELFVFMMEFYNDDGSESSLIAPSPACIQKPVLTASFITSVIAMAPFAMSIMGFSILASFVLMRTPYSKSQSDTSPGSLDRLLLGPARWIFLGPLGFGIFLCSVEYSHIFEIRTEDIDQNWGFGQLLAMLMLLLPILEGIEAFKGQHKQSHQIPSYR
jgi:hypothetical protein